MNLEAAFTAWCADFQSNYLSQEAYENGDTGSSSMFRR